MVAMLFATLSLAIAIRVMFTIVLTQIVYVPNIGQHASANATDVLICPVKNSAVLGKNTSSIVVTQVIFTILNLTTYRSPLKTVSSATLPTLAVGHFLRIFTRTIPASESSGRSRYKASFYHHSLLARWSRRYPARWSCKNLARKGCWSSRICYRPLRWHWRRWQSCTVGYTEIRLEKWVGNVNYGLFLRRQVISTGRLWLASYWDFCRGPCSLVSAHSLHHGQPCLRQFW